jgi:hypothetical protein
MFWFMTVIMVLAALSMISCGGGDGGPLPQANPTLIGENGGGGGGGVGGGGQCSSGIIGSSTTGACVILDSQCLLVQCLDIATPGWCNLWNNTGGFYNATWYSDQTCAQLGY